MAISQGSSIIYTDLKSKYDSFNTFITNYGGSIGTLTVPANSPAKVNASDINNLNTKITAFKNDEFLSTKSSWWVNKTVTAGNLAYASDWTNINTTITNFANVKCRNRGTYSYTNKNNKCNTQGYHNHKCTSQGSNSIACTSNGSNSVACTSNGSNSVACTSNGSNSQDCSSNGSNSVTCTSNGNHGQTCTQGTCTQNCSSQGTCTRTSGASFDGATGHCYATCTGKAGHQVYTGLPGGCNYVVSISYSTSTTTCSSMNSRSITFKITKHSSNPFKGKSYYNYGASGCTINPATADANWYANYEGVVVHTATACTYSSNSNSSCGYGNNGVSCSYGAKNHNCTSQGTKNHKCTSLGTKNHKCTSQGTKNHNCTSQGTKNHKCTSQGSKSVDCSSNGARNVDCSNVANSHTTFIDITCQKTTGTQ